VNKWTQTCCSAVLVCLRAVSSRDRCVACCMFFNTSSSQMFPLFSLYSFICLSKQERTCPCLAQGRVVVQDPSIEIAKSGICVGFALPLLYRSWPLYSIIYIYIYIYIYTERYVFY